MFQTVKKCPRLYKYCISLKKMWRISININIISRYIYEYTHCNKINKHSQTKKNVYRFISMSGQLKS